MLFWGKPLLLHPDEGATVNYVVEMLERHSWEAQSYDRPDHFEIKCDAILFTIVSWVKYEKEEGIWSLLSPHSGNAIEVLGNEDTSQNRLNLGEATGEETQQWDIIKDEKYCYLVNGENMALSYNEEGIALVEFTRADNQRWIINQENLE